MRRDNLIHALASTKFSARKPPSLSFNNPYFAKFLFWMKALIVPSGSSGMVLLVSLYSFVCSLRQPSPVVAVVDGVLRVRLPFRAFRAARGRVQTGQRSVLGGMLP